MNDLWHALTRAVLFYIIVDGCAEFFATHSMHQNDKKKIKISIQFLRWKAVHFVAHMRENKKKQNNVVNIQIATNIRFLHLSTNVATIKIFRGNTHGCLRSITGRSLFVHMQSDLRRFAMLWRHRPECFTNFPTIFFGLRRVYYESRWASLNENKR